MVSHLFYYQLALLALIWLFIMLHLGWPRRSAPLPPALGTPIKPQRQRSTAPKTFEGLAHKPSCAWCEQDTGETNPAPPVRPDPMPSTNRRPRTVDTSMHFCPHTECDYRGWPGLNNLRANGHPSGGPGGSFSAPRADGYFPAHYGTIFHGKQAAVEMIVRVLACLAEGLGIRATARVFEVDANTVLHWLVEAAEELTAFSAYFLCDLHVKQLQHGASLASSVGWCLGPWSEFSRCCQRVAARSLQHVSSASTSTSASGWQQESDGGQRRISTGQFVRFWRGNVSRIGQRW